MLLRIEAVILKVKRLYICETGCRDTDLQSVTYHIGSHSVTCHLTWVNFPRINPRQIGWYTIYLPPSDGRLS